MFDTLTYARKLKEAGVPERQAEVQAEMISETIESNLATKENLKALETALKRDMKELEAALKRDMKELETALKRDMKELETALKYDIKELELKFEGRFTAVEGRFALIQWMLGVVIAGILSLVLKAFFVG